MTTRPAKPTSARRLRPIMQQQQQQQQQQQSGGAGLAETAGGGDPASKTTSRAQALRQARQQKLLPPKQQQRKPRGKNMWAHVSSKVDSKGQWQPPAAKSKAARPGKAKLTPVRVPCMPAAQRCFRRVCFSRGPVLRAPPQRLRA